MSNLILGRHHVAIVATASNMYILYNDGTNWILYQVTSIAPGGGSASSIWTQLITTEWTGETGPGSLASPVTGVIVFAGYDDTFHGIAHQTPDNASSWSIVLPSDASSGQFNSVKYDRTNPAIVWMVNSTLALQLRNPVSISDGAVFVSRLVDTLPSDTGSTNCAPLQDGDKCYVLAHLSSGSPPPIYIYRMDSSGGGAGSPQIYSVDMEVRFLEVDPTTPNDAYAILYGSATELWKLDWGGATLTHVSAEPWDTANDFVGGLIITNTGVMVVNAIDGSGTVQTIYYSSDGGATWSSVDMSAYIPSALFLSYTSTGIAFFVSNAGQVVYSSDNGVTWQATGVILPTGGYAWDYTAS